MKKIELNEIISEYKNKDVLLEQKLKKIFSCDYIAARNMVVFLRNNGYDGDKLYSELSNEYKLRLRKK